MTGPGMILQFHIEARRAPHSAYGRRAAGEHSGFFDLLKGFGRTFDNRKRTAGFGIALVPVFQADKHPRHVLAVAARAGAHGGENRHHIVFLLGEEILLHLLHHFEGLLLSGTAGQLYRGDKHPPVFQR